MNGWNRRPFQVDTDGRRRMKTVSRRTAMTMALAAPAVVGRSEAQETLQADVDELIRRTEEQMQAFMAGDMTRWAALIRLSNDFTLMQPFGGPASHGFDDSPEHLAEMARYFRNGDGTLEMGKAYVSPGMVVLVFIERQRGEVGGLPSQDWSLRVTQVYRRQGGRWLLAHRHADPLATRMGLEDAAALARSA